MAKTIIAGGGIVENDNGEILFIFRRGKWDLPKGKLDKGETIEQCAVREVMEETGLVDVQLSELVGITHHQYNEKGVEIDKESHWYAMKAPGQQTMTPQAEEDILETKWVAKNEIDEVLKNTFQNITDIISTYLKR